MVAAVNTETIKLTKPQRELLDLLESRDHRKMGVSCASNYKPALALVHLGLAEWRNPRYVTRLFLTDAGREFLQ